MKDLSVGSSLNKEFSRDVKWPCQAMKLRHPDLVDISEGLVPFNHLGNLRPFAVENSGKPVPLVCTQIREIVFKPCDFFGTQWTSKKMLCDAASKKNSHLLVDHLGICHFIPNLRKVRESVKPMAAAVVLATSHSLQRDSNHIAVGLDWTWGQATSPGDTWQAICRRGLEISHAKCKISRS